jgi:glycosyltransferase involved in cell wall biosynthesis
MSPTPQPMSPATLHVAAMPFPTLQGTQAAVKAMVGALADGGRSTALLTYGHGLDGEVPAGLQWHRMRNAVPVRSLRSGPSAGKVALDAQLAWTLRRIHGLNGSRPVVVAHHVEACAAALAAGTRPLVYVAHTALGPELPAYFPRPASGVLRRAGHRVEGALVRRADAVAAVCPALAAHLRRAHGVAATVLPVPWEAAPASPASARHDARRRLGLGDETSVALYAGNLDAYQGWEDAVASVVSVARDLPTAHLLVATASDAGPLLALARRAGVAHRVRVAPLRGEADRCAVHAAADLALVPRRTPGGLPIKLLDALARGVPVVAAARATAGLAVEEATAVVRDDDPAALALAWVRVARSPSQAAALAARGRAYLQAHHTPAAFVAAMDVAVAAAAGADPPARRPMG